jgi:hypothetical protein
LWSTPIAKDIVTEPGGSFERRYSIEIAHSAINPSYDQPPFGPFDGCVPIKRLIVGVGGCFLGIIIAVVGIVRDRAWMMVVGYCAFVFGSLVWLTGHTNCADGMGPGKWNGQIKFVEERMPFSGDIIHWKFPAHSSKKEAA